MDDAQFEYDNRKRSLGVAYFLWLLFGMFGAHHYYLGNSKKGGLFAKITFVGIFVLLIGLTTDDFVVPGIGLLALVGLAVCVLVDAFTMPQIVADTNRQIFNDIKGRHQPSDKY